MKNLYRRLQCFLFRHQCKETGRRGVIIYEVQCQRCSGVFVTHPDYGWLVRGTPQTEEIFDGTLYGKCYGSKQPL